MFAVIRHYHFKPQDSAEIDKMVRENFVPLIKKANGFVRYYWLDTGKGEGHLSASSRIKLVLMSRSFWPRTTSKLICPNSLI